MTTRPGGRTAAVRAAVLTAAADLLIESGLVALELTAVAERAGVGKSTVYRRWGTVSAIVDDLLVDMAETSQRRPDTGSLQEDLLSVARLIQRTLADRRQGSLFKAILAAGTCDVRTAEALAGFYRIRVEEMAPIVTDAVTRGQAPAGTDPAEVIRQLSAPLYYRLLTDTAPLRRADADRAAAATLAAVAAGVFTR
ncbi:TetR family transcriptional regulator [Mycobacterium sp. Root265]|uniref:TetR/AcrR family transcriptional regulator n=1 Tax=Mycobacterium sp. Root265 TaxID=1736504 RepID=UPI00070B1471|nr:TetR/AcrR family transcriptional regulator [Mycobacterium sp. Root265]KRD04881.1 TetR family transcriptional regulator [Mycobacterium sp. Root265]